MDIKILKPMVVLISGVRVDKIDQYHFGRLFWDALVTFNMRAGDEKVAHYPNGFTITSGCETSRTHTSGTVHHDGGAIDVRIRDMFADGLPAYCALWWSRVMVYWMEVAQEFPEYVFILESNHVHVQVGYKNVIGESFFKDLPNFYFKHK